MRGLVGVHQIGQAIMKDDEKNKMLRVRYPLERGKGLSCARVVQEWRTIATILDNERRKATTGFVSFVCILPHDIWSSALSLLGLVFNCWITFLAGCFILRKRQIPTSMDSSRYHFLYAHCLLITVHSDPRQVLSQLF